MVIIVAVLIAVVIIVLIRSGSSNTQDESVISIEQKSRTTERNQKQKQSPTETEKAEELFQRAESLRLDEPETAFQLYLCAAKMGHVLAMTHAAASYITKGMGARFDPEQSADWYERAAEQGEYNSMINLSRYYMTGVGREEDDRTATMWLQKASCATGEKYEKTAEVAEKWLQSYDMTKSVMQSIMLAAVEVGGLPNQEGQQLYEEALKCRESEPEKAFQLALQAAKAGHDGAMTYVGAAYLYQGMGTSFDPTQSAFWYEKAAREGVNSAMLQLAEFYMTGVGRKQDDNYAKAWLKKASFATETGNQEAAKQAAEWLKNYEDIKAFRKAVMEAAVKHGGLSQRKS